MNTTRLRGIVVAGIAVAVLSGCTPSATNADGSQMDHTDAMAELDAVLLIAQNAVGGEWEVADDGAEPCQLPSGDTGVTYSFARFGPPLPLDQQPAAVDTVMAGWAAEDFTPSAGTDMVQDFEIRTVGYPTSGVDNNGMYMAFRVGVNGSSVLGATRCVPGDYAQINRDYHAEQSATPTPAQ